MKRLSKAELGKNDQESSRVVGEMLQEAEKNPEARRQLTEDARDIIQDKGSPNKAKAHSMFLLGKMQAETATEQLVEMLDEPVIGPNEKRIPYGQANALSALVMIGEKAVPVLKEKTDTISNAKLRSLVSTIFIITKQTAFIKQKVQERIDRANAEDKPALEELLSDINTWQ
jgi:hypothetical protein